MFRKLFTLSILCTLPMMATNAQAAEQAITKAMVQNMYQELAQTLNDKTYAETIKILHEHISDNAEFKMSVKQAATNNNSGENAFEMNKADYINSYIQGTANISNYNMDIKTTGFHYDPAANEALTIDVMTESGQVLNPQDLLKKPNKSFVSRTTCQTKHALEGQKIVTKNKTCHTDVSFVEDI